MKGGCLNQWSVDGAEDHDTRGERVLRILESENRTESNVRHMRGSRRYRQVDKGVMNRERARVPASCADLSTGITSSVERPVTCNEIALSGELEINILAGLARLILPR